MTLRLLTLGFLALFGAAAAPAQVDTEPIPDSLRLKNDPAAEMDLGALQVIPVGVRKDGKVRGAPYLCRTSVLGGYQEEGSLSLPDTLLGRPIGAVLPWLRGLSPGEDGAHVLAGRSWVLISLLGKGDAPEMDPEEWARLRVFFPDLGRKPRKLSGHQRAHLWVLRLLREQAALGELLGLDEEGRLKFHETGSPPLAHRRFELYLFDEAKAHEGFGTHLFEPGAEPLVGALISNVPVPVPVAAVLLSDAPDAALWQRFSFSSTLLTLTRVRYEAGGPPPWFVFGLAHFMAQRRRDPRASKDLSGTLPRTDEPIRDWDQEVRDSIVARRAADLVALSSAGYRSLTPALRVQSESLVRYLIGVSPEKFVDLVARMYRAPADQSRALGLNTAVGQAYNVQLKMLERAWRAWASRRR